MSAPSMATWKISQTSKLMGSLTQREDARGKQIRRTIREQWIPVLREKNTTFSLQLPLALAIDVVHGRSRGFPGAGHIDLARDAQMSYK